VSGATSLIIDDGGPAALAACLLCEDAGAGLLWIPRTPSAGTRRIEAVRRHADLLGFPAPIEAAASADRGPLTTPRLLLDAAAQAAERGCSRVIWPLLLGEDFDAMALAGDQASLVTHLAQLEPETSVAIETPFLDLTDAQFLDLARELDLPVDACWWCEQEGAAPCGRCGECRRFHPLLAIASRPAGVASA